MTNPVNPYLLPVLAALVVAALLLIAAHRWDVGDWPRPGGDAAAGRSGGTWIKVSLFTVALVGVFVRTGDVVTASSGGGHRAQTPLSEVGPAAGEQIFWGAGKCHTCHSVGARGGKIRGPNLGASSGGSGPTTPAANPGDPPGSAQVNHLPIGLRAATIAAERAATLGRPMTGTDYLVESLANPSAYLSPGYTDEMPKAFLPPVSLTADQITSLILYLQSLGTTPDPAAIRLPPEVARAAALQAAASTGTWTAYLPGDSARGREIFFDLRRPTACARCHRVGEQGGDVGPELGTIGATRTPQFIVESLLDPGRDITEGYETIRLSTDDNRTLEGVVRRETPDSLWLGTSQGSRLMIPIGLIVTRTRLDLSLMPGDLSQQINVKDFHDLLAFLKSLQPYVAGDSARGRALFFDATGPAACSRCHRVGNEGGDAGPEITALAAIRSPSFLLEAILKPSKQIASGYQTVRILTNSGRAVEGVVVRETPDSVWLGTADGGHLALPARGIQQRRTLPSSLMPDTLAKALNAKDLGDLMAFLEALR